MELESFKDTFGKNAKRKRPNLSGKTSLVGLLEQAEEKQSGYDHSKDTDLHKADHSIKNEAWDKRVEAGQSKRIWEELYKVLDSSDVVV